MPYSAQHRAAAHRHARCCRATRNTWASWNFRRPADGRARPGHRHLRPHPAPAAAPPTPTTSSRSAARTSSTRPTVIDRMEYEHPLYTPASVAAPGPPARDRHRPDRLRRRLPRLGLPRGRRPLRPRGRRAARRDVAAGRRSGRGPAQRAVLETSRTGLYDDDDHPRPPYAVPAHLHPPLADVAGRPRPPARPRRLRRAASRPATTSATPTRPCARTSTPSWRTTASSSRGGRILMAANARAFGYWFNPISVFWCFDRRRRARRRRSSRCTTPTATGTPTSCTPTSRAARRTDKAMYVSPFHGTDGTYELAVPEPGDRAAGRGHPAHRRRRRVQRRRSPGPARPRGPLRAAPAALRGAAARSGPTASGSGRGGSRSGPDPTTHLRRRCSDSRSLPTAVVTDLARPPRRPRPDRAPWSPRASRAGCSPPRQPAARHRPRRDRRRRPAIRLGRGGPEMTVHRPDEFFARIGTDGLIGFGEAYLTGAWDADDLGGFLTVLAAELPTPGPGPAAAAARGVRRPAAAAPEELGRQLAHQHRPPLRPVQRAVRDVPRRDAHLLLARCSTPRGPSCGDHHAAVPPTPTAAPRRTSSARRRCARSSGCSTTPASAPGRRCSRSAPGGASWRSAPPVGAPPSAVVTLSVEQQSLARERVARPRRPTGRSTRPGVGRAVRLPADPVDGGSTTPSARSR